ncbi:MAG: FG-GAP repeat protein, partial [Thermomicrobiales bacterium]
MRRSLSGSPLLRLTVPGVLVALLCVTLGAAAPHPVARALPALMPPASGALPASLAPHVNVAMAGDDPAYAVTGVTGGGSALRDANPAQRFTTTFAPAGVTITGRDHPAVGFALAIVGDAAPRPIAPVTSGQRIEYRRGNVTEWYINGPLGLEQGFTLSSPPAGQRTGTLVLAVDVTGATVREDGADGLLLVTDDGGRLRYGALTATDAMGRSLPARLAADGYAIQIIVQDAGAIYPLVIDPLVQQARLTSDDGAANDAFGVAVSVSRDGGTALIGASNKNNTQGAAYVFTRVGASWSQQARLTASDGAANDRFGVSVALSGDGGTALVGASEHAEVIGSIGSYQGAAYIFTRVGARWGETQELTSGDGAAGDHFGNAVAVSEDGSTALVGAYGKTIGGNYHQGAAYVFIMVGASWSQQQELTAGDGVRLDQFGSSVAVNANGTISLVGASNKTIGANDNQGAVYVFARVGASWSPQQRLT